MNESKRSHTSPPYIPYRTFRNWLDGLKAGVPARIDRSVLGNMAGVVQSQLLATLRFLNLIDQDGIPEELLARLSKADGQDRQKLQADALKAAYPFMFAHGFNLQTATPKLIEEQFQKAGVSGDTVRKCVAFFLLAAKDAGLPISPHIKTPRRVVRRSGNGQRTRRNQSEPIRSAAEKDNNPEPGRAAPPLLSDLLAKFPTFDPAWPDEVKAKWFESFDRLMKSVQQGA